MRRTVHHTMGHHNVSYVASWKHPASWIHADDQIALTVGMAWWFALALVGLIYLVAMFSKFYRYNTMLTGLVRIIILCLMLGVAYMYTEARMLLYERADDVIVRTPLVLMSACLIVVLVHVGSVHCRLLEEHARLVWWLGLIGTLLTTIASFAPAVQQWPGWVIGALFYVPIPFAWVALQRRAVGFDWHVMIWSNGWIVLRVLYAVLQLSGHTFAADDGLDTTTEIALMFVLHAATMVPLVYAFVFTPLERLAGNQ